MIKQLTSPSRRKLLRFAGASAIGVGLSGILISNATAGKQSKPKNPPPGDDPTTEQMIKHLRRANQVAKIAMEAGHHPFGAVLVAKDNETILMEQGNISSVAHAESTLAQRAAQKYTPEQLWGTTLYSTAEPCVMCAGTQYWANIGRLVYGMSERQLLDLTGNHDENPTLDVPSRYVFSKGQKAIKIWGPVEEVVQEIADLHKAFWT
ncbi:nucleoside deaminase [Glaciecola sp. KUL10]|uniref:nucleoside deaminase n=1 Tax=Glaciecola sp. (strain KUL10) TaxID=2161813 RepID=UPI000D7853ED|nr:nucleoside deaminase [Glaciecola sp. KUL10]GBL05244.1 CMP/dCMP deaminase [Glaciecola sp. KUL10]